jgi:putative hemolysin
MVERGYRFLIGCASMSMADGGEPAWDPEFNTADFFVFLPLSRVSARYARHVLKAA